MSRKGSRDGLDSSGGKGRMGGSVVSHSNNSNSNSNSSSNIINSSRPAAIKKGGFFGRSRSTTATTTTTTTSSMPAAATTTTNPHQTEYEPNPVIPSPPASPGNTPHKKSWEKQMKRFLKGKRKDSKDTTTTTTSASQRSSASAALGSSPSSIGGTASTSTASRSPRSSPVHSSAAINPSHSPVTAANTASNTASNTAAANTPTITSSTRHSNLPNFSIMPGTKRLLVSRTSHKANNQNNNIHQCTAPKGAIHGTPPQEHTSIPQDVALPSLDQQQHRRSESTPNFQHKSPQTADASLDASLSSSQRRRRQGSNSPKTASPNNNPGFFQNMFSRSTSDQKMHRRHKSNNAVDELDNARRRGHIKTTVTDDDDDDYYASGQDVSTTQQQRSPQVCSTEPAVPVSPGPICHDTSAEDENDVFANATMYSTGGLASSLSATSLSSSSYLNQFVQKQTAYIDQQQSSMLRVQSQPENAFRSHQMMSAYGSASNTYDPSLSPQHSELGLVLEQSEDGDDNTFYQGSSCTSNFPYYQPPHNLQSHRFSHENLPQLPQILPNGSVVTNPAPNLQRYQRHSAPPTSFLSSQLQQFHQQQQHSNTATRQATSPPDMHAPTSHVGGAAHYNPHQRHSLSSSAGSLEPDADLKRAFTEFHNMAQFATDSTSPFLGDDPAQSYRHDTITGYNGMMMRGSSVGGDLGALHAYSERTYGQYPQHVSTSLPFETADANYLAINKSMRLLKPVEGTESWQHGRRYLISPAALAACPFSVVSNLAGSFVQTAADAADADTAQAFGTIDLGEALITYVGEKHHLSLGKWSRCRLVLRQNYLLEYDLAAPIQGKPRGFAHLECAVAYPHDKFMDSLELTFYASPCAKADQRVLMIRVPKREDRDNWIVCLNDAARLRISDLYDYDERVAFGQGRYATVYPARRKTKDYYDQDTAGLPSLALNIDKDRDKVLKHCSCALKVVDKTQFWSRVVKGRERADTLVRELSVQATLTARGGRAHTFLKILGIFETSDNFVIELELLDGTDLFDYMHKNGTLSEPEAASITKDILSSVIVMGRVGLAHRDIKPANILMCNKEGDGAKVKVGDFGMSTFVGVDGLVRGRCGTPGYVAPEIFGAGKRVGYGNKVDVFSTGVTLYVLLCGYEPFFGETEKDLIKANRKAKIDFRSKDWKKVSNEAKDLISSMTKPNPDDRLSATEAMEHPWMVKFCSNPPDSLHSKSACKSQESFGQSARAELGACCIS